MNKLIENNRRKIIDMCEANQVKSLYFFGSIISDKKFHKDSDIDVLVSFKTDEISIEEYADYYFNLIFSLENLFEREIDLTTEQSIKNPFFKEELDNTKVLFFDSLAEING